MKKYFYSHGNEKHGPFSLEEMKTKNIRKETLIWYEGLSDWTPAGDIQVFVDILEITPPPLTADEIVPLSKEVECPFCKAILELDEDEQTRGEYTCSNCNKLVTNNSIGTSMFKNPFSFKGRIRRMEYGLSMIIYVFLLAIVNSIFQSRGDAMFLLIAYIPLLWFALAQGAKRCHDRGNSGFFQVIPFYGLWMLFADGNIGANEYGYNPKGLN